MGQNGLILLFLLLPAAFISGWWLASSRSGKRSRASNRHLHPDYFKGLNYVLNEQPDKAIEIFVKLIEVDSETVETHLALGNLFRRRGEVDRAIRIHQNLIARPNLEREYRSQALLELGIDYLRLGILDRAEGLFMELIAMDMFTIQAFTHLLDIYQQEKDWNKSISTARRLETITGLQNAKLISQFYCELAEENLAVDDNKSAKANLKRALNLDPSCVRASLLEAGILIQDENYRSAINTLKRIEKQDVEYIDEALVPMQECHARIGKEDKFRKYLEELTGRIKNMRPALMLTDLIAASDGESEAINFFTNYLNETPTLVGVDHFLNYAIVKSEGELRTQLSSIKELTVKLLNSLAKYKCNVCGFEARNIHWYCPGCKNWNTVKPVHGI